MKLSRLKLYKILFNPVKIFKSFSCCDLSDVESKYSRPPLLKNKALPTARQIAEKKWIQETSWLHVICPSKYYDHHLCAAKPCFLSLTGQSYFLYAWHEKECNAIFSQNFWLCNFRFVVRGSKIYLQQLWKYLRLRRHWYRLFLPLASSSSCTWLFVFTTFCYQDSCDSKILYQGRCWAIQCQMLSSPPSKMFWSPCFLKGVCQFHLTDKLESREN